MDYSYKIWRYPHQPRPLVPQGSVVLVGGCFDIFHFGHLTFLTQAQQYGDHLVVALESDDAIRIYKNRTPFHTQEQRAALLASLGHVNEVILLPPFTQDTDYAHFVHQICPDVIAVTEGDPQYENKKNQIQSIGGKIVTATPLI